MATATGSARPAPSLRRRLVLGLALAAAFAALAEAVLVNAAWYRYEDRLIERVITEQLRRSVEVHEREPTRAFPNTPDLRLYVVPDGIAAEGAGLPAYLRELIDGLPAVPQASDAVVVREVRRPDGQRRHVGVARHGAGVFVLAYDDAEHQDRRTRLLWSLVTIVLVVAALAAWGAHALADRLLGGLSALRRDVARGTADTPLRVPDMDTELAELAEALDEQRRQVAGALRKERAFAAAASHELRTPLTRIGTAADVLLAQPGLTDAVAQRVRSIRGSVDELQRLLDVLLQVARWQPGPGPTAPAPATEPPRPLGELVARCLSRVDAEARLLGTTIELDLDSPARPVERPAMLEVVLSNLLRNAIRHGRGAPVTVSGRGAVLDVRDRGPGIAPEGLGRVFDPFWRGASGSADGGPAGHGLGLTIAERVCAAAGWTLSVGCAETGPGTRARIALEGGGAAR